MELQVGMYVRIQNGLIIGKINALPNEAGHEIELETKNGIGLYIGEWNIKAASFNLIDLIEEGDFINGHRVVYKDDDIIQVDCAGWIESDEKGWISYQDYDEDIESVVTHEQFSSMEYKVNN